MTKIIQCLFGDQGSNLIDEGLVIEEIVCIGFYFKHLLNSIFVIFLSFIGLIAKRNVSLVR